LLQQPLELVIGSSLRHFLAADDVPAFDALLAKSLLVPGKKEVRLVRADGSQFAVQLSCSLVEVQGSSGFCIVVTDLTERADAEQALRVSEERFRSLISHVMDYALISLDPAGYITGWNEGAQRMNGYSASEIVGHNISRLYGLEDLAKDTPGRLLRLAAKSGTARNAGWHVRRDGSRYWAETVISTQWDEQGRLRGFSKVICDRTEQRQAALALEMSEAKYRLIVESATEGIWIGDEENRTIYVNRQMAEMLDSGVEEMLAKSFFDFMDDEGRRDAENLFVRRLPGRVERHDVRFVTQGGRDVFAIVSTVPLFDSEREYTGQMAMVTDITERRNLEAQYAHAQKMESIGRLAGGVAHDFNNLLTVINVHSELLMRSLRVGHPARERLSYIIKAGESAAEITLQLLAFSRKQVPRPKVLDLNHLVRDVENMLRRLLPEDIVLAINLSPQPAMVTVDSGQMTTVLINLALNARDAMPHGGHLTIQTSEMEWNHHSKHPPDLKPGAYVELTVADSGMGMDETTRAHIFEPFFTTKSVGRGTGLGLATVYGVVKQAAGSIEVESEPQKGTIFRICLPPAHAESSVAKQKREHHRHRGSETILLVEDQPELRNLVKSILEECGYCVLTAENGVQALARSGQHDGPIHLLLTDVVMPELNGRELARQLLAPRPSMRILYMSGYTNDVVVDRDDADGRVSFLQKPFSSDLLTKTVKELLT
jgi:PAS domain S-box-containing protein